ncbi:hypothetical protein FACS189445_2500 [Spirochaetia bacterium]|nr:hypothetical protein FACS189445_2500 [Spirochaetia bacterium]
MAISDKVKALLKLRGKNNGGLAEYLGISVQALSNKFYRDSYSGEDLIKIAAYLECELAFIADDSIKIALTLDDLKTTGGGQIGMAKPGNHAYI